MPRIGRPRVTTSQEDEYMVQKLQKMEKPNAEDLSKQLSELGIVDVQAQTLRRRLREAHLHGRALVKKPLLSPKHIKDRLEFGLKHQSWSVDEWRKVLFTDETKINKMGSDGRKWTWKKKGEPLERKHVKITVKHDASIMAWGCFGASGVGNIHVIEEKMNANID